MSSSQLKIELREYGISTKGLVEKSELVKNLAKARAELQQREKEISEASSEDRELLIGSMTSKEIKKELQERGISAEPFFDEKELLEVLVKVIEEAVRRTIEEKPQPTPHAQYSHPEVDGGDTRREPPTCVNSKVNASGISKTKSDGTDFHADATRNAERHSR
eukprot:9308851-Ditylum_brightwellii.AAC.1